MTNRQLDEERIFHLARKQPDIDARTEYLDQVCAGDQNLRERVEALLEVHDNEQAFLKSVPDAAPTVDHTPLTEHPGKHRPDVVTEFCFRRRPRRPLDHIHRLVARLVGAPDSLHVEPLLVSKVVVDSRHVHPGSLTNLAKRSRFETLLRENRTGGIQDSAACVIFCHGARLQ